MILFSRSSAAATAVSPIGAVQLRRRGRGSRGSALVEFAFVAPLLAFFIYGIVAFGVILAQKNSMTHAAAEGARSSLSVPGVVAPTEAQRVDQARATVVSSLSWMGSKFQPGTVAAPVDLEVTTGTCKSMLDPPDTSADTTRCIKVEINYPYNARPLVPPAPGLGLVTPDSIGSTAVLRIS